MMDSLGGFLLVITAGICWIGVGMAVFSSGPYWKTGKKQAGRSS